MVTMPSEAAESYELVKGLVEAGMDVMRVNCAHDSEREWESMIAHMRRANQESGKHCKAQIDLAGPKLRTGPIHRGYHVVRWRAAKDARGAVITPRVSSSSVSARARGLAPLDALLPVPETLLRAARLGDIVRITDSHEKKRHLTVIHKADDGCVCSCEQGAYVLSRAELSLLRDGREIAAGRVGDLPFVEEPIRLNAARFTGPDQGTENTRPSGHRDVPHISCTLPEAFSAAQAGQPIFFDDGKIEGRIREVHPDHMLVEIVHPANGAKLGSAKGINLPETDLGIGAMTRRTGATSTLSANTPRSSVCPSSYAARGCPGVAAGTGRARAEPVGNRPQDRKPRDSTSSPSP